MQRSNTLKIKIENVDKANLAIYDFFTNNGVARRVSFDATLEHGIKYIDIPGDIVEFLYQKELIDSFCAYVSGK